MRIKHLSIALGALFFAGAAVAQDTGNCATHTVARGETLRLIAERYYGSRDSSPVIFQANRSVVGGDPNLIEVGMVLAIPCAGNAAAVTAAAPAATTATRSVAAQPAPAAVALAPSSGAHIVAVIAEKPFVSTELDGGGMMTAFVSSAITRSGATSPVIELSPLGTAATLAAMTTNGDLAVAFPVVMPDCESEFIGETSKMLCEDFYFSAPLYEVTTTLFTRRADNFSALVPADLTGKNVCIPSMYPLEEIQEVGLAWTPETMLEVETVQECFDALLAGDVDMVYADFLTVDHTIGIVDMRPDISNLGAFIWNKTVHAVADNRNAAGVDLLSAVNAGFATMLDSGEWRSMMNDFLS